MFRYIKNLISGNFARWNENHNKLIAEIWEATEKFDLIEKQIAQEVIIASMTITDTYLGPNRKKDLLLKEITDKQIKTLEYMDYDEILKGLIILYMTLLSIRNDVLTPYCKSIIKKLYSKNLIIKDQLETVDKNRVKVIMNEGLSSFIIASKVIPNEDIGFSFSFINMVAQQIEPMEYRLVSNINSEN